MYIVLGVLAIGIVGTLWACLKVASDSDDMDGR